MEITNQHMTGFVLGIGASAVAYYYYTKNRSSVNQWLETQGIKLPEHEQQDYSKLSIEDLEREKEKLEDLIAEREYVGEKKTDNSAVKEDEDK